MKVTVMCEYVDQSSFVCKAKGFRYVRIHFPKMLRQSMLNRQSMRLDFYIFRRCPNIMNSLTSFLKFLVVSRSVLIPSRNSSLF